MSFFAREKVRNQEKGVLAKGVSAESSVTPRKQKISGGIGPSSAFSTQSATAKRGVDFCKKMLLANKKTFSWFLRHVAPISSTRARLRSSLWAGITQRVTTELSFGSRDQSREFVLHSSPVKLRSAKKAVIVPAPVRDTHSGPWNKTVET